jgi:hypothetical protein
MQVSCKKGWTFSMTAKMHVFSKYTLFHVQHNLRGNLFPKRGADEDLINIGAGPEGFRFIYAVRAG